MNHLSNNTNPPFSIVLVNYKTLDITKACLELLHKHVGHRNIPVWVVDNDSADESVEYLRSLDWINLIERKPAGKEAGHMAHGRALDMALARVSTDYLFLLHTDTFIYDESVFDMMLSKCLNDPQVAAAGCVEQLDRGVIRSSWRYASRLYKHHYRRLKQALGLRSKDPKPWREVHLKSFCTLWNCGLMKQHDLHFQLDDRVPGYTLQDRMVEMGYTVEFISPGTIFKYLDHIQAGTVAAAGGYENTHRRSKMYNDMLKRIGKSGFAQ